VETQKKMQKWQEKESLRRTIIEKTRMLQKYSIYKRRQKKWLDENNK